MEYVVAQSQRRFSTERLHSPAPLGSKAQLRAITISHLHFMGFMPNAECTPSMSMTAPYLTETVLERYGAASQVLLVALEQNLAGPSVRQRTWELAE
jgi:hypothetical protein